MALYDGTHHVLVRMVWEDEFIRELEIRVVAEGWSGVAREYYGVDNLSEFAANLKRFDETLTGDAVFDCGENSLRFYVLDSVGHVACFVRLKSRIDWPPGNRPEPSNQLALEVRTEASFVTLFRRALERVVQGSSGDAILVTE